MTRRTFIGTGSAALAAAASLKTMVAARAAGANEKINIALIGCGGMGRYKLGNFCDSKQVNVVAVCDIDDKCMNDAVALVEQKLGTQPAKIKEFRKVLDRKDIDAVIVGTPDHWHAIPMILACQAEKDVYCEKPCCHNIREGVAMRKAAEKYKRVVQVGTHQRSMPHIQAAREFVQAGKLGLVSMTNTYTYGNNYPTNLGNDPDSPVPPGVDYDTWLGPAPFRDFNKRRFHSTWRWYFDYGCGMVGDWNVHLQDIVMWSMGVLAPVAVSTSGGHLLLEDDRDTPDVMQAVYEFGPVEKLAPKGFVQTYTMRKTSGKPWSCGGYGMDLHGTNGYMHMERGVWKLEADRVDWDKAASGQDSPFRIEGFKKDAPSGDTQAHLDHVLNFLECVRTRKAPIANIESHYHSVVSCHLANVSLQVHRKIFWDHERVACFKDAGLTQEDAEANDLLGREYRKGFELPKV
jgi:predicted dehydrogenase